MMVQADLTTRETGDKEEVIRTINQSATIHHTSQGKSILMKIFVIWDWLSKWLIKKKPQSSLLIISINI